jgi:hypothetical protein
MSIIMPRGVLSLDGPVQRWRDKKNCRADAKSVAKQNIKSVRRVFVHVPRFTPSRVVPSFPSRARERASVPHDTANEI